ncbi:hypothetical protein [Spirosoma gilvum]
MKAINLLLLGGSLLACSTQDREGQQTGAAAGLGDNYVARRVSGVWLLSTDYHYRERCNYLPEEFIRNLFHLGDQVELTRYTELNSCELRWGGNKIGFYLESEKPFESTYQSEYYFNKLFEPKANQAADQQATAEPALSGPAPEGTNAETPASTTVASSKQDSTRGADPNSPIQGITKQTPPIASPAHDTPTGEAVSQVGDKAIWEPGKKTLHVLHNNHVFSVVAQMPGNQASLKQGAISLAKLVVESLNDTTD